MKIAANENLNMNEKDLESIEIKIAESFENEINNEELKATERIKENNKSKKHSAMSNCLSLRLTEREKNEIIENQKKKLKNFRIQQVRFQAKKESARILNAVKMEEETQKNIIKEMLKENWEKEHLEKLNSCQKQYNCDIEYYGDAHKKAEIERNLIEVAENQKEIDKRIAAQRGRKALRELNLKNEEEVHIEENIKKQRKKVMLQEKDRALKVVSKPLPSAFKPKIKEISAPTKKVTFHQAGTFLTSTYVPPSDIIVKEDKNYQQSAFKAAEIEQGNIAITKTLTSIKESEVNQKIEERGKIALKKEQEKRRQVFGEDFQHDFITDMDVLDASQKEKDMKELKREIENLPKIEPISLQGELEPFKLDKPKASKRVGELELDPLISDFLPSRKVDVDNAAIVKEKFVFKPFGKKKLGEQKKDKIFDRKDELLSKKRDFSGQTESTLTTPSILSSDISSRYTSLGRPTKSTLTTPSSLSSDVSSSYTIDEKFTERLHNLLDKMKDTSMRDTTVTTVKTDYLKFPSLRNLLSKSNVLDASISNLNKRLEEGSRKNLQKSYETEGTEYYKLPFVDLSRDTIDKFHKIISPMQSSSSSAESKTQYYNFPTSSSTNDELNTIWESLEKIKKQRQKVKSLIDSNKEISPKRVDEKVQKEKFIQSPAQISAPSRVYAEHIKPDGSGGKIQSKAQKFQSKKREILQHYIKKLLEMRRSDFENISASTVGSSGISLNSKSSLDNLINFNQIKNSVITQASTSTKISSETEVKPSKIVIKPKTVPLKGFLKSDKIDGKHSDRCSSVTSSSYSGIDTIPSKLSEETYSSPSSCSVSTNFSYTEINFSSDLDYTLRKKIYSQLQQLNVVQSDQKTGEKSDLGVNEMNDYIKQSLKSFIKSGGNGKEASSIAYSTPTSYETPSREDTKNNSADNNNLEPRKNILEKDKFQFSVLPSKEQDSIVLSPITQTDISETKDSISDLNDVENITIENNAVREDGKYVEQSKKFEKEKFQLSVPQFKEQDSSFLSLITQTEISKSNDSTLVSNDNKSATLTTEHNSITLNSNTEPEKDQFKKGNFQFLVTEFQTQDSTVLSPIPHTELSTTDSVSSNDFKNATTESTLLPSDSASSDSPLPDIRELMRQHNLHWGPSMVSKMDFTDQKSDSNNSLH